jgi:hypothetical protein
VPDQRLVRRRPAQEGNAHPGVADPALRPDERGLDGRRHQQPDHSRLPPDGGATDYFAKDLYAAQVFLGHRDSKTTHDYIGLGPKDLGQAISRRSERKRAGGRG